jgi:arabinan endo-1,5-alpha-L-arabinosidase
MVAQVRRRVRCGQRACAIAVGAGAWLGVVSSPVIAYPRPAHVTGFTLTHDPVLVVRPHASPRYFLFGTANEALTSNDRIHFINRSPAISPPLWWQRFGTSTDWGPDVSVHDGIYWMYYAVSTRGSQRSAIGLATSWTGELGTFVDRGIVFQTARGDPYNAIAPNLMVDASGRWWLTFGSFWRGVYTMEVSPTTGKPTSRNPTLYHLAERTGIPGGSDPIEGAVIFRHGGYYYLFASFDYCCIGARSNYSVHVGRSASPTGPYYGPAGVSMLESGGGTVLASHDNIVAPGGQSVDHDGDQDILVYHYLDANTHDWNLPFLGINRLGWDRNGWPYVW